MPTINPSGEVERVTVLEGPAGPVGPAGPSGSRGPQGDRGERGPRGEVGRSVQVWQQRGRPLDAEPGDLWFAEGDVRIMAPSGQWMSMIGPVGAKGERGERGETGAQGRAGERGEAGPPPSRATLMPLIESVVQANRESLRGEPGKDGERGPAGKDGIGVIGEPGIAGPPGPAGMRGPEGREATPPRGAIVLWPRDVPLQPGWEIVPMPRGLDWWVRVWQRLVGGEDVPVPIRKT
jgi:hypothetical protein